MKEIYAKIQKCRDAIKATKVEKLGWNDYSKYKYFLPEQVHDLVNEVTKPEKLFCKYDLDKNEFGIFATLTIIDLETGNEIIFKMITDIPEIKATNIAQQLGGAVTYSNRYLLMTVFDIQDNSLDFDTPQKTTKPQTEPTDFNQDYEPKEDNKQWLNKWNIDKTEEKAAYWEIVKGAKEKNLKVSDLRKHYKINKEVAKELENDLF